MNWIKNRKIFSKLIIGFTIVLLSATVIACTSILNLYSIREKSNELYTQNTLPLAIISDISTAYQQIRVLIREPIIEGTTNSISTESFNQINTLKTHLDKLLVEYGKTIQDDTEEKLYQDLITAMNVYEPVKLQIIKLAMDGKTSESIALMRGDGIKLADVIEKDIAALVELQKENAGHKSDDNNAAAKQSIIIIISMNIAVVVLSIIISIFISSIISKPIKEINKASDKLSTGDFSISLVSESNEEIGQLTHSFMNIVNSFNDVLSNINVSAEQVSSSSKQVSISSQTLSQSATEQASSVQQITSSMDEISAQTKENANNANNANSLALLAKNKAEKGNGQMQNMLDAMDAINEASTKISNIIKVIDEIAFQTNILALNAAVEAARAGQHGKGFAVVAEEVRNLAARSASAAKETTSMIENSIAKVSSGTKIANETAQALNEIVFDVAKVTALVENIANASSNQATGITQINQAIIQVSQVVQTNSATAEETAAASQELSGQADVLRSMVGKFKLKSKVAEKGYSGLSPEILKAIEDMVQNKGTAPQQILPQRNKSKINLGDNDFGKY